MSLMSDSIVRKKTEKLSGRILGRSYIEGVKNHAFPITAALQAKILCIFGYLNLAGSSIFSGYLWLLFIITGKILQPASSSLESSLQNSGFLTM